MELSDRQKEQLAIHWQRVKEANAAFNLTAITDDREAADKHYADCLLAAEELAPLAPGSRVLDIGSGAGFPGLVLAVAFPQLSFFLLEATGKKCTFLEECAQAMGLSNVTVLNSRAEEIGRDAAFRGSFDLVTARAVAALSILCEYAMPLLKEGGILLALKGAIYQEEVDQAANAFALLGCSVAASRLAALPGGEQRALLQIRKDGPTPDKYPRRPGMPNKRPL